MVHQNLERVHILIQKVFPVLTVLHTKLAYLTFHVNERLETTESDFKIFFDYHLTV